MLQRSAEHWSFRCRLVDRIVSRILRRCHQNAVFYGNTPTYKPSNTLSYPHTLTHPPSLTHTPSFPPTTKEPWGPDGRWHIDGYGFQHYLFSSDIGLVAIMMFSDVHADGGGTAVAEGSHRLAARVLLEAGEMSDTPILSSHVLSTHDTSYQHMTRSCRHSRLHDS